VRSTPWLLLFDRDRSVIVGDQTYTDQNRCSHWVPRGQIGGTHFAGAPEKLLMPSGGKLDVPRDST
jgi:hypothetical protein